MRLCVDENLAGNELLNRLERAGHQVFSVAPGMADLDVWLLAQHRSAAVLTKDAPDFVAIASSVGDHAGLLVVHSEGDRTRDMTPADIARAISRVEQRHPDGVQGQVIVVNHYRS